MSNHWTGRKHKDSSKELIKLKRALQAPSHTTSHSEKSKKLISLSRKGKNKGESNVNWKGGISLDPELYRLKIRELQAGRKMSDFCESCKIPASELKRRLCFDHDHDTGKFRGWICDRCNMALGYVKDSREILEALIKYIDKSKLI